MLNLAEPHVMSLKPYVPGHPIENDQSIKSWAKLASNENCLGPSEAVIKACSKALINAHLYPDAKRILVINEICRHLKEYDIAYDQVALGNGTSEIIVNLVRGLLGHDEQLVYGWPSFIMYRQAALTHGRKNIAVPLNQHFDYDLDAMLSAIKDEKNKVKLVIIANPNNPTGKYLPHNMVLDFINNVPPDVVVVIDEAYFEYVVKADYQSCLLLTKTRPRTIVLRTMSKVYGLAGLRLGYAVGDKDVITILCRIRDPFNVNTIAQEAAMAALEDTHHVKKSIQHNQTNRSILTDGLRNFGFLVHDSVGNFVMAKRSCFMPSIKEICHKISLDGVMVRPLDTYDLDDYVRISVGQKNEITQLFTSLKSVLKTAYPRK